MKILERLFVMMDLVIMEPILHVKNYMVYKLENGPAGIDVIIKNFGWMM